MTARLPEARTCVQPMPDLDLFGEAPTPVARHSNAGRPRVPLRTMIALLYLKHAFNLSAEALVECWSETPRWQYFCGQAYYEDDALSFRLESGGLNALSP
jgi:hypothetical protein